MAYVELEEFAAYLAPGYGGTTDDAALQVSLDSAHSDVDRYCGWGPDGFNGDTSATALTFPRQPDPLRFVLPRGFHTTTGLVITTDDNDDGTFETTWDTADYELEPTSNIWNDVDGFPYFRIRAVSAKTFPITGDRTGVVQVTAQWGWAAVPVDVKSAVMQRAAILNDRRKSLNGRDPTTGFRAGGRDRDWELVLSSYRHPRMAALV